MRLKFLQTVSSDSPEYPFRAGQVIVVDRLTKQHREWIAHERAVLLDDPPPDDEALSVASRAHHGTAPERSHALMDAHWSLVTGPALEPITLRDAKAHCRVSHTNDDEVLTAYIRAAREAAENYMSRGLYTQTWQLQISSFSGVISLPRAAPLQSVGGVQYYDADGVLQTLATTGYVVDTVSRPGRISLASGQTFPATQAGRTGGIVITYVIGWDNVVDIPERIKQGIRMHVAYQDADREGLEALANTARNSAELCWDDRVYWLES